MKKSRKISPSKYLRRYGKAKPSRPDITKEEVEAVLEMSISDERFEELLESFLGGSSKGRTFSLKNSDKHVNLAQDAEHRQDWEGAKKHWKNAALASIKHDAHRGTSRSDKLKVRGITMRKEEVEQIDELSKKTLKSYVKKAGKSASDHRNVGDVEDEKANTPNGKLSKNYDVHHKASKLHYNKSNKRLDGIDTAAKKLRREEVEQIDELSKPLLKRYVKRAEQSDDSHQLHANHYSNRKDNTEHNAKMVKKHYEKSVKRHGGIQNAKVKLSKEAVELSSSRKDRVNSLLAKHQAKGLPKKGDKKCAREYTGDGLPLIAAVINQESSLNESRTYRKTRPSHEDSNSKRSAGYPPKSTYTKKLSNSKERAAKKETVRKAMDESVLKEWKKSTTTKHTCGGVSFGKKATKGTCPRCDELHDGHAPVKWDHSKKHSDEQRSREIKAHDCKKSKCGPVCTFGDY